MAEGPGCIVDAGIIDDKCKLTTNAKTKFIKTIKDELTFGTVNLPTPPLFPCGEPVQPNPFASQLALEDETKFPEFHKHILGTYEKVACALNMKSDFKVLPICCPISLGFKLGIDISIDDFPGGFIPFVIPNPPLLALKLNLMPPPKLIAKFPGIPSVPPPLPSIEVPPNIKVPDFSTLFDFSLSLATGIPKLFLNVVAKVPQLVMKLPVLPELFKAVSEIAFESKLFGDIKPTSTVQLVAVKVLTAKIVEMILIAAIGTTIGSSPAGIVGGLGKFLGYVPPTAKKSSGSQTQRDKILAYANELADTSYGQGGDKQEAYASRLLPVEYPEPQLPMPPGDARALGKSKTLSVLAEISSSGLLARACLSNGGASYVFDSKVDTSKQSASTNLYYDFFIDRYKPNTAIAGIISAAKTKNALIQYTSGDLPHLKKGDVIIVHRKGVKGNEHAIVLIEDYQPGTLTMKTVEGGQIDHKNGNRPTMVKKKEYINAKKVQKNSDKFSMYMGADNQVVIAGRTVLAIIDSKKLCTDKTGTDMSKQNGSIDTSIASDGPGEGFQEYEA